MPKAQILQILQERGFVQQITDESSLDELLAKDKTIPVYIGFDCTAKTLHVGSLIQIMVLRWLQKCGFAPIVLFGGGTTKVGDPSGRDETRKILTTADIEQNLQGIKRVIGKFLDQDKLIYVNNDEWLAKLSYIDFLRNVGRHFSVNKMLSFESVKSRLDREQNLSFLEFNYMLLQAYDFVELFKKYNCRLQIGGSDQWGNIINGIDLARRLGLKELFGLTTPLITTASGAKMGKTAQGAVWLTEEDLTPYDYWQFWRNVEDADVIRFLKLFTELPLEEINKLAELKDNKINEAKKILADEATKICHGNEAAKKASDTSQKTFEEGKTGADLPEISLQQAELVQGVPIFKLLADLGLVESNKAAKRLINGGGARINDIKITDENQAVTIKDFAQNNIVKLSAGKKKHGVVYLYPS